MMGRTSTDIAGMRVTTEGQIAGESDELAMFFVIDSGVPMIITSHVLIENLGIKKVALFLV
jgi:hypothetical protein